MAQAYGCATLSASMASVPFEVSEQDLVALQTLSAQRTAEVRLVERARLLLLSSQGVSDRTMAREVGCCRATPARWRQRFMARRLEFPEASAERLLADGQRTGRPAQLRDEVWVDVLALATSEPSTHGLPITHWTSAELAAVAVATGSAPHLSASHVRAFLAECKLQPHRVKEWMNRPADPEFEARAHKVKELTAQASAAGPSQHIVVSFDEKTVRPRAATLTADSAQI